VPESNAAGQKKRSADDETASVASGGSRRSNQSKQSDQSYSGRSYKKRKDDRTRKIPNIFMEAAKEIRSDKGKEVRFRGHAKVAELIAEKGEEPEDHCRLFYWKKKVRELFMKKPAIAENSEDDWVDESM
jgi:hypothetical protein